MAIFAWVSNYVTYCLESNYFLSACLIVYRRIKHAINASIEIQRLRTNPINLQNLLAVDGGKENRKMEKYRQKMLP
jgi:hypothetical protein